MKSAREMMHEHLFKQMIQSAEEARGNGAQEAVDLLTAAVRACETARGPVWTRRRLEMMTSEVMAPSVN